MVSNGHLVETKYSLNKTRIGENMCGIAGWVDHKGQVSTEVLGTMRDALVHRGPDGHGLWHNNRNTVGLAHRRLSIIDLSEDANQPMHDILNETSIIFNGEIYNHRALREGLEKEGGRFKTDHSDTECLLVGYRLWGIERLLSKLIGMFAFAIYDSRVDHLICARDRVGIKPFYYAETSSGLIFASEIKALLKHPLINPELDEQSLSSQLTFRSLPAPQTLFKNVKCLAPSQMMVVDLKASNSPTFRTYWNPLDTHTTNESLSADEVEEKLNDILTDSVSLRLESDVPVGLFLSGGLDSALLLKYIKRAGGNNLGTYTVGYPENLAFDESDTAAELALGENTDHHRVNLNERDFLHSFSDVAYHQDQPISAPVCVSVYHLSKTASESNRKVILAGEGADEVFFGYNTWVKSRKMQSGYNAISNVMGENVLGLPQFMSQFSMGYNSKAREVFYRLSQKKPVFWGGGMDFGNLAKAELLGTDANNDDTFDRCLSPIVDEYLQKGNSEDHAAFMSFLDLRFRLPQLMLPRLDKMGMAHSIEGRVPYLDHRLIEFIYQLPKEYRGGIGNQTKPLLKSVAKRQLPSSFVDQKKRGFQAPVSQWKKSAFGQHFLPSLTSFAAKTGLFTPVGIQRLISSKNDRLYFSLVNFMLWYCIFIDNVIGLDIDTAKDRS